MAKKKKKKTGSIIFLMAATFVVFICIYLCTPTLYGRLKENQYESTLSTLTQQLTNSSDVNTLITRYAIENNAAVHVYSGNRALTYETPSLTSTSNLEKSATYKNQEGTTMYVDIQYANQDLNILKKTLQTVLPIALILILLVIYFYESLYGSTRRDDFTIFRKETKAMLALKANAKLPTNSSDKLKNETAKNINALYQQLLMTFDALQNKVNETNVLKKETATLLDQIKQNVSQPIDDIKAIVNGMIREEGKYRNHQIYLIETKMRLDQLENDISQRLDQGPIQTKPNGLYIHSLFESLLKPYEALALKKQVGIRYRWEKDFKTNLNEFLFTQAISHLMQFTLKQCQNQSNILVVQNDYDIIIAYKGAALTPASTKTVRETDEDLKELFKIIQSIDLYVDYGTTQKKDGMQFVFHF